MSSSSSLSSCIQPTRLGGGLKQKKQKQKQMMKQMMMKRPRLSLSSDVNTPTTTTIITTIDTTTTADNTTTTDNTTAAREVPLQYSPYSLDGPDSEMLSKTDRAAQRKVAHSAIERRRRERINEKIGMLRTLVPVSESACIPASCVPGNGGGLPPQHHK